MSHIPNVLRLCVEMWHLSLLWYWNIDLLLSSSSKLRSNLNED